jgi:hypothetical protein
MPGQGSGSLCRNWRLSLSTETIIVKKSDSIGKKTRADTKPNKYPVLIPISNLAGIA